MTTLTQAGIATFSSRWEHQKDGNRSLRNFTRACHFNPLRPDLNVTEVTTHTLSLAAASMREAGLANATVNRLVSTVCAALSTCEDMGVIVQSPRYRRMREKEGRKYVMPDDVWERFSTILHQLSPSCSRKAVFLRETGCRSGEASKLQWEDVSINCKTRDTCSFRDTKNGQDRLVPLSRMAVRIVDLQQGMRTWLATPFPVSDSKFSRNWAKARELVGQASNPEFVPHCLRHTFASRLSEKGVPIQHIKELLGHSDISMTMRYTHTSQEALRESINK